MKSGAKVRKKIDIDKKIGEKVRNICVLKGKEENICAWMRRTLTLYRKRIERYPHMNVRSIYATKAKEGREFCA